VFVLFFVIFSSPFFIDFENVKGKYVTSKLFLDCTHLCYIMKNNAFAKDKKAKFRHCSNTKTFSRIYIFNILPYDSLRLELGLINLEH
jgi:hypothetical protein